MTEITHWLQLGQSKAFLQTKDDTLFDIGK